MVEIDPAEASWAVCPPRTQQLAVVCGAQGTHRGEHGLVILST